MRWYWYDVPISEDEYASRKAGRVTILAALVEQKTLVAQLIDDFL
jgi:hypothetical protein